LLFPQFCLGCGTQGNRLCENCSRKLKLQNKSAKDYGLEKSNIEEIYIAGHYDEDRILATAIKRFKYGQEVEIGKHLGYFLNFFWGGRVEILRLTDLTRWEELTNATIVPIPLASKRQRERGFNQAEILARYICEKNGNELFIGLKRRDDRRHLAKLNKVNRADKIRGSFYLDEKLETDVIIVDDIITTGATIEEAAQTLKASGAKKIYGLILAKG